MVCNLEFENKNNKVVKHTLNPGVQKYVRTTNVGPMRKAKDTALNRIVGISMEEKKICNMFTTNIKAAAAF